MIPTAFDKTLCPDGYHIMSLFTQWVPSDWNEQPHTEELQAYADRMIDCYNEVAPNFKSSILHRDIVGPYEMEHDYGLIGGNIFHGELSLEQLFHMRPAPGFADYRTPVPGLYYASSATHAGGGVCGIPGMQAARAAIADRKTARRTQAAAPPFVTVSAHDQQAGRRPASSAVTAMLEARSVALVGASARPGSLGARMVDQVARSPSRPRTYLVNPRYPDIGGVPCLPSLAEVPEPADLVLLAVPDTALEDQLALAARTRARSAVIFGNAFDANGATGLRDRLAGIATDAGMALCGAGCMGFVNVARGLRAVGYVEPDPVPAGPVALITHSGSVFSTLLRARRGFGFSLAVSSGQELVTTAAAYARYALQLRETRVLALVLEAIRDAAGLRAALETALTTDVPVVLLSVGLSHAGKNLVSAHSGALAAADGAWEALAGAYGVHRVRDLAELSDTLELFAGGTQVPQQDRHRDGPRLRPGTCARRGPRRRARRAVRPGRPGHHRPAREGDRPRPGTRQPARRVGHRPGHRAAVRRVPGRAGRRSAGRRRRPRRRPGAGARRRRGLPKCRAHRRERHGQAGRRAGRPARQRRSGRRRPAARRGRAGPGGHPQRPARAAPPAGARRPPRAAQPRAAGRGPRPGGSAGRRSCPPAPRAARSCSTCCATTASRPCAPGPPAPAPEPSRPPPRSATRSCSRPTSRASRTSPTSGECGSAWPARPRPAPPTTTCRPASARACWSARRPRPAPNWPWAWSATPPSVPCWSSAPGAS